jgi:TatD DNase family protein
MQPLFIDSHLHFDTFDESGEVDAVLERAAEVGVSRFVAIGGTVDANALAARLAGQYPGRVLAVAGYDRDEAGGDPPTGPLKEVLDRPGVAGVGETGLDYHYSPDTASAQCSLFEAMLGQAADRRLPVIVHSRDADEDMLTRLSRHADGWQGDPGRLGVLHCFTGSAPFAGRLLELGLHISFSGIVAFKNADDLRGVAAEIPDDRLLIETDAPYLAPPPWRGKRNEPAYVVKVAEALAAVRGTSVEEIARITTSNAERLFGFA